MYSVVFIMDKSGSMSSLGVEPVDSLNNFYDLQVKSGEFNTTLIFFNDKVEFIHKNIESSNIKKINYEDYKPNGMTALYDAIGEAIEYQKTIQNENVIVVILTDGHENSSQKYRGNQIKELTSKLENDNGWKFIYLGANQDSFDVGSQIGVNTTADYEYTPLGLNCIMRTISHNVSECLSGVKKACDIDLKEDVVENLNVTFDSVNDTRNVALNS